MPIFGQVWLWSSLAFLLGAVLCWLLVARPARNRVGELEAQLATRARRQMAADHPELGRRPEPSRRRDDDADFGRSLVPGLGEPRTEEDSDYLTRSYALRETPPLPPERDRLAPYADPLPNRDFAMPEPFGEAEPFGVFDNALSAPPEPPPESPPESPPAEQAPSSAATQYLDVSAGSLSAPPEVPASSPPPSDRGWFDDELEGDAANQGPEEQPAIPRNRHHMVTPFVDDDVDDTADEERSLAEALDGGEEPRSAIEDDSTGTVFTQRTQPIPRELIRQIDEAGSDEQDGFVDDLADDPAEPEAARSERTVESEPVERPEEPAAAETGSEYAAADEYAAAEHTAAEHTAAEHTAAEHTAAEHTAAEHTAAEHTATGEHALAPEHAAAEPEASAPPEEPAEQTEVVAAVREKPNDLPRRVPMQSRMPGVAVRVDPTPSALPKRVPGKPRHQVPFGVQSDSTQDPAPAAATTVTAAVPQDDEAASSRSLFEPIVPAADEGTSTPPPPHRLRQASSGGRGPFGPGSAMPLPGGASPSPEFTIKASVAALRYCTPESPQFGRTVAEVWFRTAADAERVGFRPVG